MFTTVVITLLNTLLMVYNFEDFFTQYYYKNIGLKDIIKSHHINKTK